MQPCSSLTLVTASVCNVAVLICGEFSTEFK